MTDRGRPVALLVPVPDDGWQALVAGGRVCAPADGSDVLDEEPTDYGLDASSRLAAMREDER